jgi:hypothetical protein
MSNSHAINPMNVLLPEDYDTPICVICQGALSDHQTYKLPECNHEFHTHCIVTWFRHNGFTHIQEDGRCPCCGNNGINNYVGGKKRGWMKFTEGEKFKFNFILNQAKKPDAPKALTSLVKKYYKKQEQLEMCEKEKKEFTKLLKTEPLVYSKAREKMCRTRTKCWNARRGVSELKNALLWFPIVPIIIPTPIDINS